jgi:cell division protein FtsB
MPSARSATAAPRRHARTAPPRPRPRKVALRRAPKLRVRWDRAGRIGLLVVLAVVVGLYVQHTLAYLSTSSQASQQQAIVDRLSRENADLERRQKSLADAATIVRDARALGMVRPGERPYVITGVPSR